MIPGALIGDIIGSVYEFNNVKSKDFPLMSERSIPTDDSFMTMAIAHALMNNSSRPHEVEERRRD